MNDAIVLEFDWQFAGKHHSVRLLLDENPLTIGRDPSNLLVLSDSSVSRQHAEITLTAAGPAILDKQSRFGTQLEQQLLSALHHAVLPEYCELYFGRQKVQLRFEAAQQHEQDFAELALQDLQQRFHKMQQQSLSTLQQLSQSPALLDRLQQEISTQFSELQQAAMQWTLQNSLLQRLNTLVHHTQGYLVLLEHTVPMIGEVIGADRGFVLMYDRRECRYQLHSCWNYPQVMQLHNDNPEVFFSQRLTRNCYEQPRLQLATSPEALASLNCPQQSGINAVLTMPLQHNNDTLAVLYLDSRQPEGFRALSDMFCKTLQAQLGLALKNAITISRALCDDLTGLCSRSMIEEQITLAMEQAKRYQHPCSLIFIDLDDFKQINDKYGHFAGDEVLRTVANLLRTLVRKADRVGRLGGEEFVVLVHHTNLDSAAVYAERIRADIAALRLDFNGTDLSISASIGVAGYYHALHNLAYRFIDCADQAMYQAKRSGKNRVCLHQPATLQLLDTATDLLRSGARG